MKGLHAERIIAVVSIMAAAVFSVIALYVVITHGNSPSGSEGAAKPTLPKHQTDVDTTTSESSESIQDQTRSKFYPGRVVKVFKYNVPVRAEPVDPMPLEPRGLGTTVLAHVNRGTKMIIEDVTNTGYVYDRHTGRRYVREWEFPVYIKVRFERDDKSIAGWISVNEVYDPDRWSFSEFKKAAKGCFWFFFIAIIIILLLSPAIRNFAAGDVSLPTGTARTPHRMNAGEFCQSLWHWIRWGG